MATATAPADIAMVCGYDDEEIESESRQEFSFCLTRGDHCIDKLADEEKIPLKVVLPPQKLNNTTRILTIDHEFEKDFDKTPIESETDNTKIGDSINVEEFECGVSVEGSEKQEWSFTFYDFDGRGKITKDDISSLMKSLCDAVGSSIKLSHSGSKTLRLKLTVAPEGGKGENATKLSGQENFKLNNLSSPNDEKKSKRTSSGDQHRRHLVEMIQKNIERHHRHTNIKRQNCDQRGSSEEPPRHRHAHREKNTNHATAEESQDRRNYYLDLAGVENNNTTTTVPAVLCNYSNNNHKHESHSKQSKHHGTREHYQKHHRSRSSDVKNETNVSMERYIRLLEETQEHGRSRSHEPDSGRVRTHRHSSVPLKASKRPVSLPTQGGGAGEDKSPHHSRRHHRHTRDKHLAMKQVAEWIEREDLWGAKEVTTAAATTVTGSCSYNEMMIVQRHEHHHMHEHHHHHHYHHYNET
ncbi:uncharacterized protein LOC141901301 [Tubulanus polymorphus]|uniref:uncharacterized protein LOC141901301 n=1 Tax=Tubulanus polymorphus TaxID=672921 RepID=UPI003DA26DBF